MADITTEREKSSGGGWGMIVVIVVLLAGTAAVVVVNIRNWISRREHKRDGWDVASYLADATDNAHHWQADAELIEILADYTDASGNAQLTNANARLKFLYQSRSLGGGGAPAQLGASAKRGTSCQLSEYVHDQRIQLSDGLREGGCGGPPVGPVRCSVVQIWQRAIAAGAPPNALANIAMSSDGGTHVWRFEIIDHQRGTTAVKQTFADDCSPAAEK